MIHFAEKGRANEDDQAITKPLPFHSFFFFFFVKNFFFFDIVKNLFSQKGVYDICRKDIKIDTVEVLMNTKIIQVFTIFEVSCKY